MQAIIDRIKSSNKTLKGVIEGNIGVGKSSIVKIFNSIESVAAIQESVKIWEELGILGDFYKDPKANALLFQSVAFVTRLAATGSNSSFGDKKIIISERSVWADRYCFAENLSEEGTMSNKEIKIYQIWHRILINGHLDKTVPDVIIYLRASPTTCKRRQEIRARESENKIPLEYFQKLHNKHEEWLLGDDNWDPAAIGVPSYKISVSDSGTITKKTSYMKNAPVFIIDIDEDYTDPEQYAEYIAGKLLEILEKYGKTAEERLEFDNRLKELSKFPNEEEIIDFVKQLHGMYITPH